MSQNLIVPLPLNGDYASELFRPTANQIYHGTCQINQGLGPGRPWYRYATDLM